MKDNLEFLYGFMVTFCNTKNMARKQTTDGYFSISCLKLSLARQNAVSQK